ncbi:MAG: hypothetical protein GXP33_01410 [Spirochaetes bacterium]|nr:hypothetical protein [Spirochaetota bacterium]
MIDCKMTGKERLTCLFEGKKIDRVPIWLLFPYHSISCYVDVYRLAGYAQVLEAANKYADILDRREFEKGFCLSVHPGIKHRLQILHEKGQVIHRHTVYSRNQVLYEETEVSNGSIRRLKRLVESIEDLGKILAMPYEPPRPSLDRYFRETEELGDQGLMMVDIGDPLQILYHLMSVENFSIWTLTEKQKLARFLDVMYERYLRLYKYLLENGVGPVYFIVGSEFAGPPVVSPDNFTDLSAHYVKGIVDLIRSYGMYSIIHYHGNLSKVLDGMKYINPDGLHTIEAPPVGDCTITRAREALGDTILIGNIQYDDFRSKSEEELEGLVKSVLMEGMSERFILSPTAGPYEENISSTMQKNYIRFIEAGYKYGKYV